MSEIIKKGNLIERIRKGEDLPEICSYVKAQIFLNGPIDTTTLEIVSYLKLFQSSFFSDYESDIIETMGLFYKNATPTDFQGLVFDMYSQFIKEKYGAEYTPMQADILKKINNEQYFSFSAPTSTGKSFVFRHLIKACINDAVIIVPSRALINEYFDRVSEIVNIKETNVLTFVDRINTKYAKRNIFILTPERARELFKNKAWLNIDLILFDEAQLSDDKSVRGLQFDSIVRRTQNAFPKAKYIFAHPFISNPEAQLKKNNIDNIVDCSNKYLQKNVGQIFYVYDDSKNKFFHFGTDPSVLGKHKLEAKFDPIEQTLAHNGSVLIYVPKSHIYNKTIFTQFKKYINLCLPLTNPEALEMIEKLRVFIGASNKDKNFYNSDMLDKLKRGIVIHHGSMPLTARLILEHFTQKGFCRICFATSTLEQGINMPFDIVYIDKFESSKSLSVKNLIGRAGRSTPKKEFDFGSVIIRQGAMSNLRKIINQDNVLSEVSRLDLQEDDLDEKYNEFKNSINKGEFSDEYNLTNDELTKLKSEPIISDMPVLLDMLFEGNEFTYQKEGSKLTREIIEDFQKIYTEYLGRELTGAEKNVLTTALKIMMWKISGKTFSKICQIRYAHVSRTVERHRFISDGKTEASEQLRANYTPPYNDIPNKNLKSYPLVSNNTYAKDVDYDRIVYDTYDYLDKLIGFKLSDIFYAAFHQYYQSTNDIRAEKMAKLLKYGTDNGKEIWMLRYGLSFEDIEWVSDCIDSVDEKEMKFNNNVVNLNEEQRRIIYPYIHD